MDSPLSGIIQAKGASLNASIHRKCSQALPAPPPIVPQNQPHPHVHKTYVGQKCSMQRHPMIPSHLKRFGKKFIQEVTRTIFVPRESGGFNHAYPSQQPRVRTSGAYRKKYMQKCLQFLDYAASQDEAILTYRGSDMNSQSTATRPTSWN